MKFLFVLVLLFSVSRLYAFDVNGMIDKADKAAKDPKLAAQQAGNSAADSAFAELTKKLKNVQNQYGPIVFMNGKADLDVTKCRRTLEAIHDIINRSAGCVVQIEGHTDNKGKAAANMALSQKRAEAVVSWLVTYAKTPANRLRPKGFGDTQPIADNKTEAGRAKNRRVDFSVSRI
jgi:outer membrane protein OmpA-like peptidoglycan-associated protein